MKYEYKVVTDEMPVTTYNENGTYETNILIEENEELLMEYYEMFLRLGYTETDARDLARLVDVFGDSCGVTINTFI